MKGTLQKIEPLHPTMVPPPGAVPFGVTPDGRQLFKEVTRRSRSLPDIDEATGQQRYRKNPLNGEPLVGMRVPEIYELTRIYFLESEGNGNIRKHDWEPPTAEELAKAERRQKVADMKDRIAEALVDKGMSPEDLIAKLLAAPAAPATNGHGADSNGAGEGEGGEQDEDATEYPVYKGGKNWLLSNQQVFVGKKVDAIDAQAAVSNAKAAAAATPEI